MECPASLFEKPAPQKCISRSFLTCTGCVTIEAKLNSHVYYPEENIMVKVELKNNTSREIKRLKVRFFRVTFLSCTRLCIFCFLLLLVSFLLCTSFLFFFVCLLFSSFISVSCFLFFRILLFPLFFLFYQFFMFLFIP